jgi:hypothetical protein
MRAYWEGRDPIALYEKFLMGEKLLDAKSKKDVEERIEKLLAAEREFAENSPMPPPEFAETGVYCTGDECHKIRPKWERPIAEVTPPKSRVKPVWTVEGFGSGTSSARNAAIHFGDTKSALETETPGTPVTTKINGSKTNGSKPAAKAPAKNSAKAGAASSSTRKVKR